MVRVPRDGGYVALMSVLLTAAAATAACLTILDVASFRARDIAATQTSVTARSMAGACAEEALQQVYDNTSFSGTGSLTIGSNTCSYTVTITAQTTRTITTTATIGNNVRKITAYATIGSSTISVSSWQDVP